MVEHEDLASFTISGSTKEEKLLVQYVNGGWSGKRGREMRQSLSRPIRGTPMVACHGK